MLSYPMMQQMMSVLVKWRSLLLAVCAEAVKAHRRDHRRSATALAQTIA